MTGQSRRKFSVVGVIALFACVIAIVLMFLIQTCGFSNGTFYYRHSDNGMYDDATAITAQVAKSSQGFLSFTADSEKGLRRHNRMPRFRRAKQLGDDR